MELHPHHIPTEKEQNTVFERLWLSYYNDALYAQNIITEAERNRMRLRIQRHM